MHNDLTRITEVSTVAVASLLHEHQNEKLQITLIVIALTLLSGVLAYLVNWFISKNIQRYNQMLEIQATTDSLTGLYNRHHFNTIYADVASSAKRKNENICFAMFDIDHFKQVNDAFGHIEGDKVLKSVATQLKESFKRQDDAVFRLGGEEFGVLLKLDDTSEITRYFEVVLKRIGSQKITLDDADEAIQVTVSAGLVCLSSSKLQYLNELYKKADELLYLAKTKGRNRLESEISDA